MSHEVNLEIWFTGKLPNFALILKFKLMIFPLDWIHFSIWLFLWTVWFQNSFAYIQSSLPNSHHFPPHLIPVIPPFLFLLYAAYSYFLTAQPGFISLLCVCPLKCHQEFATHCKEWSFFLSSFDFTSQLWFYTADHTFSSLKSPSFETLEIVNIL